MTVTPSPNRSKPPAFNDLHDDVFEEMCCSLLEKEPQITIADRFKTRYKKQFGVDICGKLKENEGLWVASCKVRQTLKKGDIPGFYQEFLQHWTTHWAGKNVKKFILAVTHAVNSDERETEIKEAEKLFQNIGVDFEPWPPRTLQERLRPHPGIVSQYLGEEWVPRLCGAPVLSPQPIHDNQGFIDSETIKQISALQERLSGLIAKQLEDAREQIKRNEGDQVDTLLSAIEKDHVQWSSLSNDTKAKVKRLQASRALHKRDISLAKDYSAQARTLDPSKGRILDALILFAESGTSAALELLRGVTEPKEYKLRANLYLIEGKEEKALADLNNLPSDEIDGEVLALYSRVYLAMGKRDDAYSKMLQAEQQFPDWYAVQKTGLMVRFGLSHSPSVPFYNTAWPSPSILELVREDDESQKLLSDAIAITDKLLKGNIADPEEHKNLQLWRLGCLSNMRARSSEAQSYAQELIAKDDTNAGAIAWSLARGYDFNLPAIKQALNNLISNKGADTAQILVLVNICLFEDNHEEAIKILENQKEFFNDSELKDVWPHWHFLATCKSDKGAHRNLSVEEELVLHIHSSLKSGQWTDLCSFLDASRDILEPKHVFLATVNLARHGQWELVTPYIPVLLKEIATSEAVQIAAISAYESGCPRRTIDILDSNTSVFPNRILPITLRRLRIAAAHREGNIPYSLSEAETLASTTKDPLDKLNYARMLIATGDTESAIPHIKKIQDTLAPSDALALSQLMIGDGNEMLARDLFQSIAIMDLSEPEKVNALFQGLRLGLDEQIGPLWTELAKAGTSNQFPILRAFTTEEALELMRSRREKAEEIDGLYNRGDIPIHLACSHTGSDLASIIVGNFSATDSLHNKPKLLVRFGGRALNKDLELSEADLYLDITSILLIFKLGIFDLLRQKIRSLTLPSTLPQALLYSENHLQPHQPDRQAAMKTIIGALEARVIFTWKSENIDENDSVSEYASQIDAFVVEHDEHLQRESARERGVNIRTVLEGLLAGGAIDATQMHKIEVSLPTYAHQSPIGKQLSENATIICRFNTIEIIALQGLLEACAKTFHMYVDPEYVEFARQTLEDAEARKGIAATISQLRCLVADGLSKGNYRTVALSDLDTSKIPPEQQNLVEQCLFELLRLKEKKNCIIMLDDRKVNSYVSINNNRILDVYDLLQMMRSKGWITNGQFYGYLLSLREANCYFLPLHSDEVLYHLKNAETPLTQGRETKALKVLRQYLSNGLLHERSLRISPNLTVRDEKTVITQSFGLVQDLLLDIWRDKGLAEPQRRTYADWALTALRVDRRAGVPNQPSNTEGLQQVYVLGLLGFVINALQISQYTESKHPLCDSYLAWVNNHILGPAVRTNEWLAKQLASAIADTVAVLLDKKQNNFENKDHEEFVKAYISRILKRLPDKIQEELTKNHFVQKSFGLRRITVITFNSLPFEVNEFWHAIKQAKSVGQAVLKTLEDGKSQEITISAAGETTVNFSLAGNTIGRLKDDILAVLSDDETARKQALTKQKLWFDYPRKQRTKTIRLICNTRDPAKRVQRTEKERTSAPSYKYHQLARNIREKGEFQWVDLSPAESKKLLLHLRFTPGGTDNISSKRNQAAEELIGDLGCVESFIRLSGAPYAIPETMRVAVAKLSSAETSTILKDMLGECHTPVRLAQYLFLIRSTLGNETSGKYFKEAMQRFLSNGGCLCRAFIAALKYFECVWFHDSNWLKLSVELRNIAVWYHADRICSTLLQGGVDAEEIYRMFSERTKKSLKYAIRCDMEYDRCPLTATNCRGKTLYLALLHLAFGDEMKKHLDKSEQDKLRNEIVVENNGKNILDISVLDDMRCYKAYKESFLVYDAYQFVEQLVGMELAGWLEPSIIDKTMESAMVELQKDPNNLRQWGVVASYYKPGWLPERVQKLLHLTTNVKFSRFFKENDDIMTELILLYISRCIQFCEDGALRKEVGNKILGEMRTIGEEYCRPIYDLKDAEQDWRINAAAQMSEAMITLSKKKDLKESIEFLGETAVKVSERVPFIVPVWRQVLDNLICELGFNDAEQLWKPFLRLRTME